MTPPDAPAQRAALVYNPTKADVDRLRTAVESAAAVTGWEAPLFYETTVEDIGAGVARRAVDDGATVVMAAGGDGTVRAVSEALAGTGVPLAIIPSGTGNLLARNLLLPLTDPEAMVRAAFDGDTLPIDIGWVSLRRPDGEREDAAFVVMGGMGIDAAMIANTNPDLKKSMGWVAYLEGAARSLTSAKPFRVMYQLPGHRLHSSKVHTVLFANCGSLQAGIELAPEASVTDGDLDIVIMQPKGPFGWILVWRRVAWDNSVLQKFRAGRQVLSLRGKDSSMIYTRGPGIEVAAGEAHAVQLDGDEFGEAVGLTVRIAEGDLLVKLPKGHETSGL